MAQFKITESVDVHCHCLPGMDDGPTTMAEALALCRALAADGITAVIATPHQLGRYDGRNSPAAIRSAVSSLNASLAAGNVGVRVVGGADVRIDERIWKLLAEDEVMTLADGGRYLLLELPQQAVINPVALLEKMQSVGVSVVLTHPERYDRLCRNPAMVLPWLERGLLLQITAGSLIGDFGPFAERACWYWLDTRCDMLVASDAHDALTRRPRMSQAIAAVSSRLGMETARRVCLENPLRILQGSAIQPVPAGRLIGERR